jgi:V/A-type H+-transporting ATPase subunit D
MARLALSKSSLSKQQTQLKTFERFLPSLDLKRRQLIAERNKAKKKLATTREEIKRYTTAVGARLPMMSYEAVDLSGLVQLTGARLTEENIVGTRLPLLDSIEVEVRDYPLMTRPHWVDAVVAELKAVMELNVRAQVEERRLELLEEAVRTITQRVNLFDKVLIPRARGNIKRIRIYLSDAERASVVNSKISKRKRATEEQLEETGS